MLAEDRVRRRHMSAAAERAGQCIAGRQHLDLDEDRMLLFALVCAIAILGEAASTISAETRAIRTDMPWRAIIGMRHRLMHAYCEITTAIAWHTVTQEIPALFPQLRTLATDE